MKNILKLILSLVIFFGVVPINGQEIVTQTCNTTEVRESCQIVLSSSEDIKKKKKKGKKIKKGKKGKKKGFFSKVFGSK